MESEALPAPHRVCCIMCVIEGFARVEPEQALREVDSGGLEKEFFNQIQGSLELTKGMRFVLLHSVQTGRNHTPISTLLRIGFTNTARPFKQSSNKPRLRLISSHIPSSFCPLAFACAVVTRVVCGSTLRRMCMHASPRRWCATRSWACCPRTPPAASASPASTSSQTMYDDQKSINRCCYESL